MTQENRDFPSEKCLDITCLLWPLAIISAPFIILFGAIDALLDYIKNHGE